jgi:hypothetical protein
MKRILWLSAAVLLGWATQSQAGVLGGHCCGDHCKPMPPPYIPDCGEPCEHGHHKCSCKKAARAAQLLQDLCAEDCCTRIKAAKHLGCRLLVDYCCNPEILDGLVKALLSDCCWKVRRHAAWSIAMQCARTEYALVALYISSRRDAHYMVRSRAAEAIDLLIICRKDCYKKLFEATDALITQLEIEKVRPGRDKAELIINSLVPHKSAAAAPAQQEQPANQQNQNQSEQMQETPPDAPQKGQY